MSGNTTISDWEFDFSDHTDRGLMTDISQRLTNMSSTNLAKRRKDKLRESLVREHIEGKQNSRSHLKSVLLKLFNIS